jgi:nucleoside phosphorylase
MPSSLLLKDVCGNVDYGIITIRQDEFTAVLDRLPGRSTVSGGRKLYEFASVAVDGGGRRGVAVVRCLSQGQGTAQSVTAQMISDLQPRVLLLVGIAGGVPSEDFGLGDVLLASRLHDFSITAARQDGGSQLNVGGGPLHKAVEKLLAHLPALLNRLPTWNSPSAIGRVQPTVTIPADINSPNLYGPDEWKRKVVESLRWHFVPSGIVRRPKAYVGPNASSNQLVKDADLVRQWQDAARSITHIEMELAGVVQAARDADQEVPVIAVRGLSDIVGFNRNSNWTGYACHSAASFCVEMIKSGVFELAAPADWSPLGPPKAALQRTQPVGVPTDQPVLVPIYNETVTIKSAVFEGAYLRLDARDYSNPEIDGGGVVNCQLSVGPWEQFRIEAQNDGTVAIASAAFAGAYLRLDARNYNDPTADGGGIVNCQLSIGPWEKFRIEPQDDGTVTIASVAFTGVYLRLDARDYDNPNVEGGGVVNCQLSIGPWEKFWLERQ